MLFGILVVVMLAAVLLKTLDAALRTPQIPIDKSGMKHEVSVVVPVRNEAERLLRKNLLDITRQSGLHLKLIVVDDDSEDHSLQIIREVATDASCNLTIVNGAPTPWGWNGKTFAMHQGLKEAASEWVAFVDADVRLKPFAVKSAIRYAEKVGVDALCVLPRFRYNSFFVGVVLPVMIWLSIIRVSPLETNNPRSNRVFGFGNFILLKRQLVAELNELKNIKGFILDDCAIFEKAKMAGGSVHIAEGADLLESHMYSSLRELVSGFTKNAFAGIGFSWAMAFGLIIGVASVFAVPLIFVLNPFLEFLAISFIVILCLVIGVRLRAPLQFFPLFPLGLVVGAFIVWRSAVIHLFRGGSKWKGRRTTTDA